jgi:hypothetical protein
MGRDDDEGDRLARIGDRSRHSCAIRLEWTLGKLARRLADLWITVFAEITQARGAPEVVLTRARDRTR